MSSAHLNPRMVSFKQTKIWKCYEIIFVEFDYSYFHFCLFESWIWMCFFYSLEFIVPHLIKLMHIYYARPIVPRCHIKYFENDVDSIGVSFVYFGRLPYKQIIFKHFRRDGRATVNDWLPQPAPPSLPYLIETNCFLLPPWYGGLKTNNSFSRLFWDNGKTSNDNNLNLYVLVPEDP